jgi:hypothetical protein
LLFSLSLGPSHDGAFPGHRVLIDVAYALFITCPVLCQVNYAPFHLRPLFHNAEIIKLVEMNQMHLHEIEFTARQATIISYAKGHL